MGQKNELQKRIVTATIGVSLLVVILGYGGVWGVRFFAWLMSCALVAEYTSMVLERSRLSVKRGVLIAMVTAVHALDMLFSDAWLAFLFAGFFFLYGFYLFGTRSEAAAHIRSQFQDLSFSVFGFLFFGFFPLFLPLMREQESGLAWLFLFLFLNWAGDIAAYFVGKSLGRTKLFPQISPKKTVEGAIGGFAASFLTAAVFHHYWLSDQPLFVLLWVSFLVQFCAQVGDLAESMIKRSFQTKDSGALLPGHGGFLDRFDGVVASAPVMYICVRMVSYS